MSDKAAAEYIRALLAGSPPNGVSPEAFGEYRDIIERLVMAHGDENTPKLWELWDHLPLIPMTGWIAIEYS